MLVVSSNILEAKVEKISGLFRIFVCQIWINMAESRRTTMEHSSNS